MLAAFDGAALRQGDVALSREILQCQRRVLKGLKVLRVLKVFKVARKQYLPPVHPGAGADVDEVVGGEHHVAVMLDDDDAVAQVAQLFEALDEALVVALVEANAGFIQYI